MKAINVIYKMFVENTGRHICDSGGAYGRNWERNQGLTMKDFQNRKPLQWEVYGEDDIYLSVDTFKYLEAAGLECDEICAKFNRINDKAQDWDGGLYGVSEKADAYLNSLGYLEKSTWNTYNDDTFLNQVLQGSYLTINDEDYLLLQVHGGCDVRGGYTNAKLFKMSQSEYLPLVSIMGEIDGIQVDTAYDGYNLTDENGEKVPFNKESEIFLEAYFNLY